MKETEARKVGEWEVCKKEKTGEAVPTSHSKLDRKRWAKDNVTDGVGLIPQERQQSLWASYDYLLTNIERQKLIRALLT